MAIVYGKELPTRCNTNKCLPTAPAYEEVCCPDPCDPCETKRCPPKTCASRAIKIEAGEIERCFALKQMGCNGRPIPAIRTCLRMDIRQKGFCKVLVKILPYRATSDNSICFKWGDYFLNLPKGYYEADIYINDDCVTHLLLLLPGCNPVVDWSEAVIDETCGGVEYKSACCAVPQYDEEFVEPKADDCNRGCDRC